MNTSLEQIRETLIPYLSDKSGSVGLPSNLFELLEDPDASARDKAEQIEALLALNAGNEISSDVLNQRLRDMLLPQVSIGSVFAYPTSDRHVPNVLTSVSSTTRQKGEEIVFAGTPQVGIAPGVEHGRAR